jgi:hypothetical protein
VVEYTKYKMKGMENGKISPFNVIPGLPLDYPMQDFCFAEERNDELPVTNAIFHNISSAGSIEISILETQEVVTHEF